MIPQTNRFTSRTSPEWQIAARPLKIDSRSSVTSDFSSRSSNNKLFSRETKGTSSEAPTFKSSFFLFSRDLTKPTYSQQIKSQTETDVEKCY